MPKLAISSLLEKFRLGFLIMMFDLLLIVVILETLGHYYLLFKAIVGPLGGTPLKFSGNLTIGKRLHISQPRACCR